MADIGYGVQLWAGANAAATTATVQVADLTGITPPALTVDDIDVTDLDGTDYVRRFIPGLIDAGEVALEMNWVPGGATEDLIRAMLLARETRYMEIRFTQLSPAVVYGGHGFFKSFAPDAPMPEKMTGAATLRCTDLWEEV
jgi:hypothetical protein